MKAVAPFLCYLLVVLSTTARADIYRWDNSQLIPGTEGITPGPGVVLDRRELAFAALFERDLTGARFDFSNLASAELEHSTVTNAPVASVAAVPEPSTVALLTVLIAILMLTRLEGLRAGRELF